MILNMANFATQTVIVGGSWKSATMSLWHIEKLPKGQFEPLEKPNIDHGSGA